MPGLGSPGSTAASASTSDDFALLRDRWLTYMVGEQPDASDPDVSAATTARDATAQTYWDSMDKSTVRTALWADQSNWSSSVLGDTIVQNLTQLRAMAVAYRSPGSSLEGNSSLAHDILSATDWIVANYFTPNAVEASNWYNWEIGSPRKLVEIMVLMYADLSGDEKTAYLASIDHWCGDPTHRVQYATTVETGANRADKALNVILRGAVGESDTKIEQGRSALDQIYPYVTSGDGFYADGSFVFHSVIAYTGGYGGPLLQSVGGAFLLLQGSQWPITNPDAQNVYAWVENAFIPVVYQGAAMDMTRGRKVSRENETDHDAGKGIAGYIAVVAEFAPSERASAYKQTIKAWLTRDAQTNYYAGQPLYIMQLLKQIANDGSIAPAPDPSYSRVFGGMDRAVQYGSAFAIGVSMFSDRISAFQYGNGENADAWWMGAGQTSIYAGDSHEYDNDYWATVDMHRLPGTTTDHSGSGTPAAFTSYPNTSDWVGGSTADGYSTLGMQFSMSQVTGSNLSGKKSWFMLGNKMVALGADITGSGDVETIVDNRRVSGSPADVGLDGADTPAGKDGRTDTEATWAHIAGTDDSTSVGYVFLQPATVTAINETRTGSWSSRNSGGSTTVRTNDFGSIAIQHGTGPTSASYAYAVLPGLSRTQTQAAAQANDVGVLQNDSAIQAVRDPSTGVVGANFWNDGTSTLVMDNSPYITVDAKASVTTHETDNAVTVAVTDPTHKNTGQIDVEIARSASGVLTVDPGMTVTQVSPTIKLSVNVAKAAGTTFHVTLQKPGTATVVPGQPGAPQATVHDGRISLAWAPVGGESGYTVRYGTDPANLAQSIDVPTVRATNTVDVTGLTDGVTYYFTVSAVNSAGTSQASPVTGATPAVVSNPMLRSAALEDAFVRDGTYATTNYGLQDHVEVKTNGGVNSGYNRYAYLKFDLSQVEDRIDSATVRLTSTYLGANGIVNELRAVADGGWTESTITYANRPADETTDTVFPAPAVGQSLDVDVTDAVRAAQAAGRDQVTLELLSPSDQGSTGQVNYASVQNADASTWPALTINDSAAPATPALSVSGTGPTSVSLSWPYVPGATSFSVRYGTSSGSIQSTREVPAAQSATATGANVYQLTGLTTGTPYFVTVVAVRGLQDSAPSNEVTATPVLAPNPTVSLSATGDAFVRDGTSYADTNYGTSTALTVKSDAVGYTRQTYLKFDLSTLTGSVSSAKLRLVPTSVGTSGITHAAYVSTDASWQESAITWNTKPALGALATTWTVPATAGTAVVLDLTNQVSAALQSGATSITVVIIQTTNQGAASSVSYASRETGTTANRPVLTIN